MGQKYRIAPNTGRYCTYVDKCKSSKGEFCRSLQGGRLPIQVAYLVSLTSRNGSLHAPPTMSEIKDFIHA